MSALARGRFITLEGIEGAGKSTVTAALTRELTTAGIVVRSTREPGGTPLAEKIRRVVLERGEERVSPETETLLMFAARAIHLDNLVRPALARGEWVLCDRFTDATRAYQGAGRGIDAQFIESLAGAVHRGLEPDLTLLLDLPVEMGLARARQRRLAAGEAVVDRFEAETRQFFERVRVGYLEIARREPQRCRVLDATRSPAEVCAAAIDVMRGLDFRGSET
ncbi:MAG: dTMP kinase [Gammaproteobacteria bacterium]|jgi:dTMP kinase